MIWIFGRRCYGALPDGVRAAGGYAMDTIVVVIDEIYVPVKRRRTLNPKTVEEIAESILAEGLQTPIWVRHDGKRYVLVEGLHRLEACKALGEQTIDGVLVQARKH